MQPRGKAVDLRNYGISYAAAEPPTSVGATVYLLSVGGDCLLARQLSERDLVDLVEGVAA